TWALLKGKAKAIGKEKTMTLDFGVHAAEQWLPPHDERRTSVAPQRKAPVLLPAFLEQWSCTSPVPTIDPEVALFLHGPEAGPGDIEIIWRADLGGTPEDEETRRAWIERLAVCPPSSLEAVSVPLAEAIRWLAGAARGDVSDLEVAERDML